MSGRSPVIRASRSASFSACSLSIATTSPPASGWSPARRPRSSLVGVAQDVGDPVAVRVQRGPQPPRGLGGGQHDVEVRPAHPTVADPLHVAAVRVERHRPADAVDQRLRVAVAVVRARDAFLVVVDPRDRRVVRAKRRAREQQPEAGALERLDRRAPPRRVLAHVVRLVGDQQRRPLGAAAAVDVGAGGDRRVGDGDAVAVARLRPGRSWAGWARAGCRSGRRRAPTGGRCASSARPPRRAPRAPRRASGGRRAARRWSCRRRASRRRGRRRRHGRRRRRRRPAARRAAAGRWARRAGSGPPRGGEERRSRTSRDRRRYETRKTDPRRAKIPLDATSPVHERGPKRTYRPDMTPPTLHGEHPPGIASPHLRYGQIGAFDAPDLKRWARLAEELMPALTVTIGLGASLFATRGRWWRAAVQPLGQPGPALRRVEGAVPHNTGAANARCCWPWRRSVVSSHTSRASFMHRDSSHRAGSWRVAGPVFASHTVFGPMTYEINTPPRPWRAAPRPGPPRPVPLRAWRRAPPARVFDHSGEALLASATARPASPAAHQPDALRGARLAGGGGAAPTTHICTSGPGHRPTTGARLKPNRPNSARA